MVYMCVVTTATQGPDGTDNVETTTTRAPIAPETVTSETGGAETVTATAAVDDATTHTALSVDATVTGKLQETIAAIVVVAEQMNLIFPSAVAITIVG